MSESGEKLGHVISAILLSREYREYVKYHERNLFGITKVSRMELLHSNFIAWLFDSSESHNLGVFPVRKLLVAIAKAKSRNKESGRLCNELILPFLSETIGIISSKVFREETFYLNGKKRSIDLIIEVNMEDGGILPIIVENKVNSHEHTEQTKDYYIETEYRYSNKRDKKEDPIYLFLVPAYNIAFATNESFITITYQDLVDYVLEPCMYKTDDNVIYNHIRTYLQCLSFQADNEKGNHIMAISKEEKGILNRFLETNKNFIKLLIEIMIEDADDEEQKEVLNKIKKEYDNKDYSKYMFEGEVYSKSRLVHAVVKKYIEDKEPSYDELIEAFPKKTQGSVGVVSKLSEVKDINRFYHKDFEILSCRDNIQIVTSNQWGIGNIERFLNQAKKLGFDIIKK